MIKDGWYCCPVCGNRIIPIEGDTIIIGAELFCKKCRSKPRPTIVQGEIHTDVEITEAAYLKGPKTIQISY